MIRELKDTEPKCTLSMRLPLIYEFTVDFSIEESTVIGQREGFKTSLKTRLKLHLS